MFVYISWDFSIDDFKMRYILWSQQHLKNPSSKSHEKFDLTNACVDTLLRHAPPLAIFLGPLILSIFDLFCRRGF